MNVKIENYYECVYWYWYWYYFYLTSHNKQAEICLLPYMKATQRVYCSHGITAIIMAYWIVAQQAAR